MEHREPPRIKEGDHLFDASLPEAARPSRLRPLIAARHTRQFDAVRVAMVLAAGLAMAIALVWLGSWAMRSTLDWLAVQPPYQIPFNQIHLVNPPPPWFLGGKDALLEGVRKSAGEPETISVLQVSPERLAMSFKKYAWVEGVKVSYAPGQIEVELRYHQPVAWVQLSSTDQIVIDEKGDILPAENVDVPKLGATIKVTGRGLSAPSDRRPGVVWKVRDETRLEKVDERISAAAKLASFLLHEPQHGDAQRSNALRVHDIIVTEFSGRGLFVITAENVEICWGDAPGDEPTGHPTAAEKWDMLRRWEQTEPTRSLVVGDYWAFSSDGVRHEGPHSDLRQQPETRKASENPAIPPLSSRNRQDRDN
jgi:hypothetical protein